MLKVVKFGGSSLADANQFRKIPTEDTLLLLLPEKEILTT